MLDNKKERWLLGLCGLGPRFDWADAAELDGVVDEGVRAPCSEVRRLTPAPLYPPECIDPS